MERKLILVLAFLTFWGLVAVAVVFPDHSQSITTTAFGAVIGWVGATVTFYFRKRGPGPDKSGGGNA